MHEQLPLWLLFFLMSFGDSFEEEAWGVHRGPAHTSNGCGSYVIVILTIVVMMYFCIKYEPEDAWSGIVFGWEWITEEPKRAWRSIGIIAAIILFGWLLKKTKQKIWR